MSGFAKIADAAMDALAGASGSAVMMYVAIARQSHFDVKWTCAELDAHARVSARTGRKARAELVKRGVVCSVENGWETTGPNGPVERPKRASDAAQTGRSGRPKRAGTPYIETLERPACSAREAGEPPPHRIRDIKARKAEHQTLVAAAMQTLRQHCEELRCGTGGLDKVRGLLTDAAVAGLDAVAVAQRLIDESPAWADCGHAGLYWSKPERLPAIIAEMQAAPVVSLTAHRDKQATRDAKHIRHALSTVPSDAPDEDAYRMVHAEAREQLQRHGLKTLADVHAWLHSQEVSHAA